MIEYFSKKIMSQAKKHAIECFPEESCGLVIDDIYLPCKNTARDPLRDFKIDTKLYIVNNDNIKCIIHSHNDFPHASKKDMQQQLATDIPWGIINLKHRNVTDIQFWGDSLPVQDLIGRTFFHGINDCYGLVRDYYRKEKGITLKQFPREMSWWLTDEHMLVNNMKEAGFNVIDKDRLEVGDVIFGSILSKSVNHSAIYVGNGLILHHLVNRLSRTEPLVRWNKYVTHYLRYEGDN